MFASKFNCVPDIISIGTLRNHCGPSLSTGIPKKDAPRCLITRFSGENETALQLCAKLLKSARIDLTAAESCDLTRHPLEPQGGGCGECLLDEFATTLPRLNIHGYVVLVDAIRTTQLGLFLGEGSRPT